MKSRLEYCDSLPEQSKYPIIRDHPSKSKLPELLINDCHLSGHHSGPEFTRRTLRNRYWIVGGKKVIQSILHKCLHKECRPLIAVIQNIPPLPAERLNTAKVFEMISLDGIGPFKIRRCGICQRKYSALTGKFGSMRCCQAAFSLLLMTASFSECPHGNRTFKVI